MRLLGRLFVLLVSAAVPVAGQQARVTATTDVRAAPGGTVVAELNSGTTWTTGSSRDGFTSVVITAWVDASRFGPARDSFPTTIGGSQNLRIRETPSLQGRILGSFRAGAGLRVLERRERWARVRREVWVPTSAITVTARAGSGATTSPNRGSDEPATRPATSPASTPAARPAAPAAPSTAATGAQAAAPQSAASDSESPAPPAAPGALRTQGNVAMHRGPGGNELGQLVAGAVVTPLARERGWVKVQIDAWIPESQLVPADTSYGATLTAADLRADPDGHKGKIVRWDVQVVGMQLADPLRRDMARDEPFLLVIGPAGENATIYVTVPQGLITESRTVAPLSTITLTARVRTGRSNPTGAPILEMMSFVRK